MTRRFWLPLVLSAALGVAAFAATTGSLAQTVGTHGIGFAKGCDSPVNVGDPYNCGFIVANTSLLDTHLDTLTFNSLVDVVHAAAGDITSGNLLSTRVIAAYTDGATCVDAANAPVPVGGTGAVLCTLPSGSAVAFARANLYTVTEADLTTGDNRIDDDATLTFVDLCTSGADDCPIGANTTQAGASADINTPTPTPTATSTPTNTPTATPTSTSTPVPPTATPTSTATPVPPTATPTATNTPVARNGCTPGFWKQTQHFDSWVGFTQSQTVGSVFSAATGTFASETLLQALNGQGGPGVDGATEILLRASVASLLNSTSNIGFPLTTAQVVSEVNTALTSGNRDTILAEATRLDGLNNAGSCSLS